MNRVESFAGASSGSAALSRRSAVLRLGGGGLAALLAGTLVPAAAQEAGPTTGTPAAGLGYLAIRQYRLAPGRTVERGDFSQKISRWLRSVACRPSSRSR
jgi:uncharacterized membrane protein YebE (DUF533 family)